MGPQVPDVPAVGTTGQPKVAVVVASAGRPELLVEVVGGVRGQTRPPEYLVVSVPDDASLPAEGLSDGVTVVRGTRGAAAQRNVGVAAVPDAELVFFFDDDAVLREDYLERAADVFARRPDVVGLTGRVLLDGAAAAEIDRDEAAEALRLSAKQDPTGAMSPSRTLYGCNFGYRASRVPQMRMDDRLPLYSWLEDHDFARRLMRVGALVKADDCVIVHRGVKSGGRQAHTRFGYSQVMNPCYFVHKGSFPLWLAAWEMFRPVAKNVAFSLTGAERPWRRERLRGNLLAGRDVLARRFTPERITELD